MEEEEEEGEGDEEDAGSTNAPKSVAARGPKIGEFQESKQIPLPAFVTQDCDRDELVESVPRHARWFGDADERHADPLAKLESLLAEPLFESIPWFHESWSGVETSC